VSFATLIALDRPSSTDDLQLGNHTNPAFYCNRNLQLIAFCFVMQKTRS